MNVKLDMNAAGRSGGFNLLVKSGAARSGKSAGSLILSNSESSASWSVNSESSSPMLNSVGEGKKDLRELKMTKLDPCDAKVNSDSVELWKAFLLCASIDSEGNLSYRR